MKNNESTRDARIVIGVDPGIKGGFAMFTPEGYAAYSFRDIMSCRDTIVDMCIDHWKCADPVVVIEQVSASPGMGVTSAFTFGRNVGDWDTMLRCLDFDINYVLPGVWSRPYRPQLPPSSEYNARKKALEQLAVELFPGVPNVTRASADALLICKYGVDNLLVEG